MHTSKVPKIVSSVSDIYNPQTTLLKQQMKRFISDIKHQFDSVITGYEQQLSQLQQQRSSLLSSSAKHKSNHHIASRSNKHIDQSTNEIDEIQQWMLPLNSNDFNVSTSSPFYRTPKRSWRDVMSPMSSPWGSVVKVREESPLQGRKEFALTMRQIGQNNNRNTTTITTSRHPSSSISSPQRSRYECQSQTKRHRQQQIVQCLQSQRKNLNQMTSKMQVMVGRGSMNADQEESINYNQQQSQLQMMSQYQQRDQHNRSLNDICGSLNNSFVSQQTRKARMKKKMLQQENKKKKQQTEIKNQKANRQLAIKNLLSRLRQNANSVQPPQTVKGSKLLSTGQGLGSSSIALVKTQRQGSPLRKSSKVMINPVPVSSPLINTSKDEGSRGFIQNKESFLEKRPASILRQSNILTRSISGISAVSFNQ